MKAKKRAVFGLMMVGIMFFLGSCKKDFNKISTARWTPDLASPFIRTKFTLNDLIGEDSTFEYTDDSLLIYYYQSDSLINITADTLVKFTDTATATQVSLQDVDIDDFSLDASFELGDVLQHIDADVADFLQQHDSDQVVIPPFGLQESFDVDIPPAPLYEYLIFSDGYLDIQIVNNLAFNLNNINYEVWDEINDQLIDQFTVDAMSPGAIANDTIWLAGKTLSNKFLIKVNNFDVPGTYPDSVQLILSNGLGFQFNTHDLKVVGGKATVNQQLNYTDDTYVDMGFDEAKITKVAFDAGILNFTFHNDFGIGVDIVLKLTSANVNGEVPTKEFSMPSNGEYNGSWDLEDMEIDLSYDSAQPYNRFPVSLDVLLIGSDDPVVFDTSQRVDIDFSTQGVVLGYVEGNVGKQVSDIESDTIDVDVSFFDAIEGDIYFDQAELSLTYVNSFGIPVLVNADFKGEKTSTGEEMNLGVDSIIFDYPQTPGEEVSSKIVFDHSNSNIVEFLNFRPDKIIYTGNAETNWNGDTTNFLTKDSKLIGSSQLKIPMVFRTSSLMFKDTSDIELDMSGITIGKGKFYFDILNGFPFDIKLNLQVPDSITGEVIDSLVIGTIPSAEVNNEGLVTAKTHKLVISAFDEDFVSNLERATKVYLVGKMVTANGGTVPVGLYSDYEMDIVISLQLQISP